MGLEEQCRFRPPLRGILLIWEITNFCNLECLHCCTNSGPNVATDNEVQTGHIVNAIGQFQQTGIREVYFSGGEPFLRKDFITILEAIDTSATDIYIASNGIAFSPRDIQRLKSILLKHITISLDGHSAELHNAVRRRSYAFDRTIAGIRACVDADIPLRVSGMITPENHSYIEQFIELLASLGVRSTVLHTVLPTGRALENPQLQLTPDYGKEILQRIIRAREQFGTQIRIDHSFAHNSSAAPIGCPAGKQVLHITANGDVSPCSWLYKINGKRFTLGNIKSDLISHCLEKSTPVMSSLVSLTRSCPIPYAYS